MHLLDTAAILITLSAAFSYLNHRFMGLPSAIGLMLMALVISFVLIVLDQLGFGIEGYALAVLSSVDFNEVLMHGMLSFLLFAGALHVNLDDLAQQKWIIGSLATGGVLLSTLIVGALTWMVLGLLGLELSLGYCLLFGALISPTDPIAVLGILRKVGAPPSLETKITGESLFNDGVGVVIFVVLLGIVAGGHDVSVPGAALLFVQEALGGVLLGIALGLGAYALLKSLDNYQVEILITLAVVMGGYTLATAVHISGPITVVVAGLLIGNHGRRLAMSEKTRAHLDTFWELVDEVLNAVLFVLLGLEVLIVTFGATELAAGLVAIPLVLAARFVAVSLPVTALRPFREFSPGVIRILTWGGLRGGISVALVLSLPPGPEREFLLPVTYCIVVFSLVVQGLTVGGLARRLAGARAR